MLSRLQALWKLVGEVQLAELYNNDFITRFSKSREFNKMVMDTHKRRELARASNVLVQNSMLLPMFGPDVVAPQAFHKNDVYKASNLDKKNQRLLLETYLSGGKVGKSCSGSGKVDKDNIYMGLRVHKPRDFRVVVKPTLASRNQNLVKQHNEAGVREDWYLEDLSLLHASKCMVYSLEDEDSLGDPFEEVMNCQGTTSSTYMWTFKSLVREHKPRAVAVSKLGFFSNSVWV
ncbi:hypothetical protein GQ457_04G024750 [Hibiscus cannabinus]